MIKNNILNFIGCIVGLAIIISGIVFLANPAESYSTDSADEAEFGADYYTLQYDATRIVTRNTAVTANNIRELSQAIAMYFGYTFIFSGALVIIHFGKGIELDDGTNKKAADDSEPSDS